MSVDPFSPLVFRNGVAARNRLVVAAMTNQQSHADGTLSDAEHDWLVRRAAGGFGVVTTCASHVTKDGQGWPGELACFDDAHLPGLTRLAAGIAAHGAVGLVQIFHGGLRADPAVSGAAPWTARVAPGVPGVTEATREGTAADLERVLAAFASAAGRAQRAGFHGVELHGAHGYLFTQFLSRFNDREDGWGGDLEGRARLLREATRAVRATVPADFVVGVRLSPEDSGNAAGLDLDESVQVARWLAEDGVDFVHLSLWDVHRNTTKRPEEHAATVFRAALPADVPLMVAGKIWSREEVDAMLAAGADAVAVARAAIGNPDWPRQLAARQPVQRPPYTPAELASRAVSPTFVQYLRRWRDFIAD